MHINHHAAKVSAKDLRWQVIPVALRGRLRAAFSRLPDWSSGFRPTYPALALLTSLRLRWLRTAKRVPRGLWGRRLWRGDRGYSANIRDVFELGIPEEFQRSHRSNGLPMLDAQGWETRKYFWNTDGCAKVF